jgi:hypothetical protein
MLTESATVRFEVPFRTKASEFHKRLVEHIRKALKLKQARRR